MRRIVATLNYLFATNNAPPPGNQQVRTNSATVANVTALYVDNDTTDAIDMRSQLLALVAGDQVDLESGVNPDRYGKFTVASSPLDHTDWVEVPVAPLETGQEFTNAACVMTLFTQAEPPPVSANFEIQAWDNDGYVDTVGKAQTVVDATVLAGVFFNTKIGASPKTGFSVVVWDVAGGRPVAALGWNSSLIN